MQCRITSCTTHLFTQRCNRSSALRSPISLAFQTTRAFIFRCDDSQFHLGGVAAACDPSGRRRVRTVGAWAWACGGVWRACPLQARSHWWGLAGRRGSFGVGAERTARGGATEQRIPLALCSGGTTGLNVSGRPP